MNDNADNLPEAPMTLRDTVAAGREKREIPAPGEGGRGKDGAETKPKLSELFSWPGRISLLLALVLSPWAYGAWEFWAQFWIVILLLVGLASWWFETAMNERRWQVFPYLFLPVAAGLLIGLIQLIGLPDWLSDIALNRQLALNDALQTATGVSNTISVNPEGTWHQIRLLIIAISGMLLGCRYFRTKGDLVLLMATMTLNGVALSIFGTLQKLTYNGKLYWVREVTLGGSPFGPFVNRNNASGYLLICLACAVGLIPIVMAYRKSKGPVNLISREMPFWRQAYQHLLEFIAELTASKLATLVAVASISIAVFAALSRGGVVAMLGAAIATILAYGMARKPKNSSFIFVPLVVLSAAIVGWIGFGDELQERFERIDTVNFSTNDIRIKHWQDTAPAIGDYGMLGSGLGSYKNVHRLYRQDHENVIFHYAENQYFQSVVEAGWIGLFFFLLAWFLAFQYAGIMLNKGSSPASIGIGTMGYFLIFSQGIASIFDFGFYIPANLLAISVVFGFLAYHAQSLGGRLKEKSWLRFQTPNYVIQVIVLALFAAACFVGVDLYSRSRLQNELYPRAVFFSPKTMDLEATDKKLATLMPMIQSKPMTEALNYVALLQLHRARLQLLKEMEQDPEFQDNIAVMPEDQKETFYDNLWNLTDLQHLHDYVSTLKRESKYAAGQFLSKPSITENLPLAAQLLNHSRRKSMLQPTVHLKLGQIRSLMEMRGTGPVPHAADADFERAVMTAPANYNFRLVSIIYYLQSGRPELAAPHVKRMLELKPIEFRNVLDLLTGRTNRSFPPVDSNLIADKMMPDNAFMLYEVALKHFPEKSPEQQVLLDRIASVLEKEEVRRHKNVVLLGDVRLLQGNQDGALEQYKQAILTDPSDRETRHKRAQILLDRGELELALEDALYNTEHGPHVTRYKNFLNEVRRQIAVRDKEKRDSADRL